ncbi:type I polyketide synthase, partial [Streptomyces cinerochromogenes]|uniref:type I polyketide synthase n=1 Tax=Streptomyces cinerochromogenes TaxID=66422 RepID=UPI0033A965A3
WQAYFAGSGARRIDLPTYAFQHQRYWVDAAVGVGDVSSAGLDRADHPLLGAAVTLADSGGVLFTGRFSLATHPWLADHTIGETVLLPGTAFVELAIRAGDEVGCGLVEELTLQEPLILPEKGGVQLQLTVGEADDSGRRKLTIHSRPETATDSPWTEHATGTLATTATQQPTTDLSPWPPAGAEAVDLDGFYDDMATAGLIYGPVFQGLTAAWRRGDEVFAEVALPEQTRETAERFGLHPALLDAALHASALTTVAGDGAALPFSWSGVTLHATGASALRVRIRPAGDHAFTLDIADPAGQPVAAVDRLTVREADTDRLTATRSPLHDWLYRIDWVKIPATPTEEVPNVEVLRCGGGDGEPDAVRAEAQRVLTAVQSWLTEERYAHSTLLVLTHGAVALPDEPVTDLAGAAVWGLVRSAQSEHPDRIILADATEDDVPLVLATGEPQTAVRNGTAYAPRLTRTTPQTEIPGTPFDGEGTVLITGGTGGLGRLVARHLATRHGVRHLILTSRRGIQAPGATDLITELADLGTEAVVEACDAADRDALAALLTRHTPTAVIHCAGILDDATITSLTPHHMDTVLRPKIDAAWHLHDLTRHLDLKAFVLFSSAAGVMGAPGQGNYAAANAYLDALATHRHTHKLPAHSLAWGLWGEAGGMNATLDEADQSRMAQAGVLPLSAADGLALLDQALNQDQPTLVPIRLDRTALTGTDVPALLSGLVPVTARRRATGTGHGQTAATLRSRLVALAPAERSAALLDLVRIHAAATLGHAGPEAIEPGRAFGELGFDSLSAVEFRNALDAATGLRLPATLIFDYPTSQELADHLVTEIAPETDDDAASAEERVRRVLTAIPFTRLRDAGLLDGLLELAGLNDAEPGLADRTAGEPDSIDAMDTESLISMALDGSNLDDATQEV